MSTLKELNTDLPRAERLSLLLLALCRGARKQLGESLRSLGVCFLSLGVHLGQKCLVLFGEDGRGFTTDRRSWLHWPPFAIVTPVDEVTYIRHFCGCERGTHQTETRQVILDGVAVGNRLRFH